jgi:uncharacterized protein YdhG (YjbR/CyaY superfamily)
MAIAQAAPGNIDDYIAAFPPEVRATLERIRQTVRAAVPEAEEAISYRMPTFKLGGVLIYFAAFQHHIGVYPPVSGDAELERALSPYAGEKGNLRFPLDQPMRYDLIERIVQLREGQLRAKAARGSRKTFAND